MISTFFIVYFIGRFVVEFWKTHQTVEETAYITMGQYLSIPGILLGAYGLWWSLKNKQPVGWPNDSADQDDLEDEDQDQDDQDDQDDDDQDDDEAATAAEAPAAAAEPGESAGTAPDETKKEP